eukprot:2417238-Karenia_brevis.AAC.1
MEIAHLSQALQMSNIQLWYCGCLVFAQLQNIASEEAPSLEAVCGGRIQTCSDDEDVVIELP